MDTEYMLAAHVGEGTAESPSLDDDMPLYHFRNISPHSCALCGKNFKSAKRLQIHNKNPCQEKVTTRRSNQIYQNHKSKRKKGEANTKVQCNICDRLFNNKSSLTAHIKNNHIGLNCTNCSICNESFTSTELYEEHMSLHDPEDRVICKDCLKEFKTIKLYLVHAKKFPNPHSFRCSDCLRNFKTESNLQSHHCISANGQSLLCACGKTFKKYSDFVGHARGSKVFTCCACDHQSKSLPSHLSHVRRHSKPKPHECGVCGSAFSSVTSLKSHMKCHDFTESFGANVPETDVKAENCETIEERVPCPDCGKSFLPNRLQAHRARHKMSPSLCAECGKLCDSPFRLTQHLMSAHNSDPVTCDICNKSLKTKKILTEHLKTHWVTETGTRVAQAVCPVCGLELAQKGSLARHIVLVHQRHLMVQDDKPKICKECGITLPNKAKYYTHRRQHRAMVERFPCHICQREFNKKQNLVRHMYLLHDSKRVMEDPSFMCQVCGRSFRERKNLLRHSRLVHKFEDIADQQ